MVTHADLQNKTHYLITMDDGEQYLAHYGVSGMKWGKWNAETAARYAGAGNGTYYKKAKRGKDEYSKLVTDKRREYNANQPKSKQIAKNVLLGPGGAHAYNTARSRGLSRSDALSVAPAGVLYAQAVKRKQRNLGSTTPKVSESARDRADYTKDETMKKTAAKQFLAGTAGSNAYNQAKAKGKSTGRAVGNAAVASIGSAALDGIIPGAAHLGQYITNRVVGGDKYGNQVNARDFNRRSPGEPSHEYLVKQERKAAKRAAMEAVDSKVSEAKEKAILEQHQEARKEFQENQKKKRKQS